MNRRKVAVLALLVILTVACHRKSRGASSTVTPPSTPVVVPPPALVVPEAPVLARTTPVAVFPVPAPDVPAIPVALMEGDSAFDSGDCAQAVRSYTAYLQTDPHSNGVDRILFRLGVAQSMCSPKDVAATDTLNRLLREYPQSSYSAPAQLILNLRADIAKAQTDAKSRENTIKQLNDELDRLKRLDADRRRTP